MSALILAVLLLTPVQQPQTWDEAWFTQVEQTGLTMTLLVDWREQHPPEVELPVVHRHWSTAGVEQWRSLVEKYFHPEDVTWALRVMQCESGGNPNAKNSHSSASGLFQHLARYWPERSVKAGWAGASIWDPEANIAVAAWLFYAPHGGPSHWTCKA